MNKPKIGNVCVEMFDKILVIWILFCYFPSVVQQELENNNAHAMTRAGHMLWPGLVSSGVSTTTKLWLLRGASQSINLVGPFFQYNSIDSITSVH